MNKKFEKSVNEVFEKCKNTLIRKNKEYANEREIFHNFSVSSALTGSTSLSALAGMMAKHTTSIYDMCTDSNYGVEYSKEQWDEKICDHINYLLLLRAMVVMNYK